MFPYYKLQYREVIGHGHSIALQFHEVNSLSEIF